MYNTLFNGGLSYKQWVNGTYIVGYDLTSSQSGGAVPFANPVVKKGKLVKTFFV